MMKPESEPKMTTSTAPSDLSTALPKDFAPAAPALVMDDTDRRLLNLVQEDFPLVARPFARIGERLELSEREVIDRILRLKEGRIVRQISAIFDSRMLGYRVPW